MMTMAQVEQTGATGGARQLADPLRQWIARLDPRFGAFAAAENLSDEQWRELEAAAAAAVRDSDNSLHIARVAKSFADVLDQRHRLMSDRARAESRGEETVLELAEFDRIWDRLQGLADELADVAAYSLRDIGIKVMIMYEFVEENSNDPVHRLAASLTEDVLKLKNAG